MQKASLYSNPEYFVTVWKKYNNINLSIETNLYDNSMRRFNLLSFVYNAKMFNIHRQMPIFTIEFSLDPMDNRILQINSQKTNYLFKRTKIATLAYLYLLHKYRIKSIKTSTEITRQGMKLFQGLQQYKIMENLKNQNEICTADINLNRVIELIFQPSLIFNNIFSKRNRLMHYHDYLKKIIRTHIITSCSA